MERCLHMLEATCLKVSELEKIQKWSQGDRNPLKIIKIQTVYKKDRIWSLNVTADQYLF